jgi:THO complex subunit 2
LAENRTKVGGKTVLLPGFQLRWSSKDHASIVPDDLLSWTAFKRILRKWHGKLGWVCAWQSSGDQSDVLSSLIESFELH